MDRDASPRRTGARLLVVGINPCLHDDQIPRDFPNRDRVWMPHQQGRAGLARTGNSVIVGPDGEIIAGPARHEETILFVDVDLTKVRAERNWFDPVGPLPSSRHLQARRRHSSSTPRGRI